MDDFRNFYQNKQNRQTEGASNTTQRAQTEFPKDTKGQMDYLKRLAGYYSEAGESKLTEDIFENVRQQKEQGKLTDADIKNLAKKFSPLLNAEQKRKLNELVAKLTEEPL